MSDWAASLEKASTMPGLVVWSSSDDQFGLFAENTAGLVDRVQRELGALDRVSAGFGAARSQARTLPILMVAPCALALPMMWGAARPAAMPAAKSRLVSFICLSLRPGFFVGRSVFAVLKDAKTCAYLRTLASRVNYYRDDCD